MSYDPVRLSLELTWWPDDNSFSMGRRLWTRPYRGDTWQLEDMATSGSPIRLQDLSDRWADAQLLAFTYFTDLVRNLGDPF